MLQDGKRQESYRYAVTPGDDKKKKKKKGKEDLDELKQELEMDEHKIPIEELYERLGTDPNSVGSFLFWWKNVDCIFEMSKSVEHLRFKGWAWFGFC